jgi:hypothetical protein
MVAVNNRVRARFLVLVPVLALGACESSSRLGSLLPDDGFRTAQRANPPAPAPLTPAPTGEVESSALPPPGGGTDAALSPPPAGQPPYYPGQAPNPGTVATAPGAYPAAPPPNVAGANPGLPAPRNTASVGPTQPAAAPSRTALIGNWSVAEAAGNKCRITLSSAPKLDLYGAGTSGCQNKDLQRVNAWELAGSEVILYEPGGGVVARLRQSGGGYAGSTTKSGAPVTLSK